MKTLRNLGIWLCLAVLPVGMRAQTAQTRASLYNEVNTTLASAQSGGITAAQLRSVFNDVVASAFNQLSDTTLNIGTAGFVDTGVAQQWTNSVGGYYQHILQNTSGATNASADFIVSNNLGTASTYYGDFGINSSTFSGAGSLAQANATYLYSSNGDLVIGSLTTGANAGNTIHFVIGNATTDAATITTAGVNVGASVRGNNATTFAGGSSVADNGSGQVSVTAGGSNQNVNLTSTGTGTVNVNGSAVAAGLDPFLATAAAMGNPLKAETFPPTQITSSNTLVSQRILFLAVYLATPQTITGVKWYQATIGNYTGNNYNGVGLYSYSAGTLTLVASSTNNAAIWQTAASGTYGTQAFSSTYAASAGLYYIAIMYSESAQTTAPILGQAQSFATTGVSSYGTNSATFASFLNTQTALPSPTQSASGLSPTASLPWLALY